MDLIASSVTRGSIEIARHRVLLSRDAQLRRALTCTSVVTDSFMLRRDGGRLTALIEYLHGTLRHFTASPAVTFADGTVNLSHKNHPVPVVISSVLRMPLTP